MERVRELHPEPGLASSWTWTPKEAPFAHVVQVARALKTILDELCAAEPHQDLRATGCTSFADGPPLPHEETRTFAPSARDADASIRFWMELTHAASIFGADSCRGSRRSEAIPTSSITK